MNIFLIAIRIYIKRVGSNKLNTNDFSDLAMKGRTMMKEDIHEGIRKKLEGKHTCYVLITCGPPTDEGEMDVKMTYGGEPIVAEYLLQGALEYFYDDHEEEKSIPC
jgi:hypothetical protein